MPLPLDVHLGLARAIGFGVILAAWAVIGYLAWAERRDRRKRGTR